MPELFIALEGTALLTLDGKPHTLHLGDALLVEPGESHELTNPTSSPITVLVASWLPATTPGQ
jgi:quercetin dioxygenase-like cupin family protein